MCIKESIQMQRDPENNVPADEPHTNHGVVQTLQTQNLQADQRHVVPPHASLGEHAPRPPGEGPRAVGVDEARAPRGEARRGSAPECAPAALRSVCRSCGLLRPLFCVTRFRCGGSERIRLWQEF